jgi:lysophospholipid acyltransferase (LPLAT)-like uncharacterized protein
MREPLAEPGAPREPRSEQDPASPSETSPVNLHYDTRLPRLPWSRRIQIPIIAAAVYTVIRALGPTLRYEMLGHQHIERTHSSGRSCVLAFWHRCIIPVVWWGRNRGIVILNTTAFDGQWTRKVIEWLGFGTAQGSSTRGGLRGLAVMAQRLEQGRDCGFTIDGPRGPRYIAKPGPVMLARKTACPIIVFHSAVDRGKTFTNTWDHFLLPAPFARAVILVAPPIYVPTGATAAVMESKQQEMQSALERVRDIAEGWFHFTEAERQKYRTEFLR